jgi:23S rRNA pseudouridine2604 synthase
MTPPRRGPAAPPRRGDAGAPAKPQPRRPPGNDPPAEGDRLSKRRAALGIASRREADEWIAAGWVRVDGRVAVLGLRVGPDVRIDVDPRANREQAQRMTVLLHKPIGYVSGQAEDGHAPASTLVRQENRWAEDRLRVPVTSLRGLAPAGRLDIDSTGLLVLTQDGRIARTLIGEDSQVEKEYLVRVRRAPSAGAEAGPLLPAEGLARLQHGLSLDDRPLKPAKVSWANEDQLRFVLREGRKRQIRRMCELVGLEVTGLKRVRIGSVVLGKLPLGQWRYLRPDEKF